MSTDVRVLIIDDELEIRNLLRLHLSPQGFKIEEAETGATGLRKAADFHPHLVLLDLGLPDRDGLEVLKELRGWTKVPVIVLTVTDDEKTKVRLLDAGADDYLTKPFGASELMARIRVALRNRGLIEATPIFQSEGLEVDLNRRQVKRAGSMVKFTNTEFEILAILVRDQGQVVSSSQIQREIWGSSWEEQSHSLRVYVNNIRKKIEANPSQPRHLVTESGVGYRLI